MTALVLVLSVAAQTASPGVEPRAEFEARLKAATGPTQLHRLAAWCAKNELKDERARVREIIAKITPPRKHGHAAAREAARRRATQAREEVAKFLDVRAESSLNKLGDIVDWMRTKEYAPDEARDRILGIARRLLDRGSEEFLELKRDVRSLPHGDHSSASLRSLASQFDSKFDSIRRQLTNQIFTAVEKCLSADEAGFAFDVYRWLLKIDPDNDRAHRGLCETKVGDRWLRPFGVAQWRQGLVWDERWGWIPRQERARARYQNGKIYDPTSKRWGTLEQFNRLHADAGKPWELESEHFLLISTAELEQNVKLIARLEAFFLQAFRRYDRFFGGKRGTALIFGTARNTKRLKVYFYRDRDQFVKHNHPPTDWADGFYSPTSRASYFYSLGRRTVRVMQHEVTHQILGEFGPRRGSGSPWIIEGAAVFLEGAAVRDGELALDGLKDDNLTAAYRQNLREGGEEHSLKAMIEKFSARDSWDNGDIRMNYRGAGAVWFFLMTFDGGRYRGDTVQMLRDDYGGWSRPVAEYYGISLDGLSFLMDRFYRECDVK